MMGHGPAGMPPPPSGGGGRGGFGGGERRHRSHDDNRPKTLAEISVTVWLTPENAKFSKKNGLLYLTLDGKEMRVILAREFPYELQWDYISVLDDERSEVGIIRSTSLFTGDERQLIEDELRLRYYAPKITKITKVREKYGFSYWTVFTSDAGKITFTVQDAYRSIFHIGENAVTICDVDGNRYEIPNVEDLDKSSRKLLDLYI